MANLEQARPTKEQLAKRQDALRYALYGGGIEGAIAKITDQSFSQRLQNALAARGVADAQEVKERIDRSKQRLEEARRYLPGERVRLLNAINNYDPEVIGAKYFSRKEGAHFEHSREGYRTAFADIHDHFRLLFENRQEPTVIKPNKVTITDFGESRGGDWFSYFGLEFTENNREKAGHVGIHYITQVVDLVQLSQLTGAIEAVRDDLIADDEDPDTFHPDEHYIVELLPIRPESPFLNHDRGLLDYTIHTYTSLPLYFDFLGEGGLHMPNPFEEIDRKFIKKLLRFAQQRMAGSTFNDSSMISKPTDILTPLFDYRGHMQTLRRRGILHFPHDPLNAFTYIKTYDRLLDSEQGTTGTGVMNIRFQIDVEELLKWRNIFADPEQVSSPSEYGKTFMVPGGVPLRAVHRWDFWEDNYDNPPQMRKERRT